MSDVHRSVIIRQNRRKNGSDVAERGIRLAKHMRKDVPFIPEDDETTQTFDVDIDDDYHEDYLTIDADREALSDDTDHEDYLTIDAEQEELSAREESDADDDFDFEPVDVSEPRELRKEAEVMKEEWKKSRREWFRSHLSYIFAGIGVVVVALIIFGVYTLYQNSNPMSRLMHAAAKDFGTSFDFDAEMTENGRSVMSYSGTVSVDRSKHRIEALYDADYDSYTYTAALTGDDNNAEKGVLYNDEWIVSGCTEKVQDFFEFDRGFRNGRFSGGAFLHFMGKSSDYHSGELKKFVNVVKKRLSTDSSIATVTSSKVDGGTQYHYNIDLYELRNMIVDDGAPVFCRASDYESFVTSFHENEKVIKSAVCTADYLIDSSGYLRSFEIKLVTYGKEFGFSCEMSNFGSASVELPESFVDAIDKKAE